MAGNVINAGIAGLGRMGRRHAENLAWRIPGVSLVAACSPEADERAHARDVLGVARRDIRIVRGPASRTKTVAVDAALDAAGLRAALAGG